MSPRARVQHAAESHALRGAVELCAAAGGSDVVAPDFCAGSVILELSAAAP